MMNDDKTPEGKQAGPSMCQHHKLIFICRQSDLTTSLPTSAPKAPSCSLPPGIYQQDLFVQSHKVWSWSQHTAQPFSGGAEAETFAMPCVIK